MADIGVVAIGRNEGERLKRCLQSVIQNAKAVVYVDSGSTDGSVAAARALGVHVVELDMSIPFTAARARNEGLEKLLKESPGIELVQFVDGDCEVLPGWLERARNDLQEKPEAAVVCGRRRERFPGVSVYNLLCDMEWNTPIGEAEACGGDALMRVQPLRDVGGYRNSLIAGEEPELCVRLRDKGWSIYRIDADMTLHDAAMTSFRQWWKRSVRAGHAFAEVSRLSRGPCRIWAKETRSNWIWGLLVPLVALAGASFMMVMWEMSLFLFLFMLYPLLIFKIYRGRRRHGDDSETAIQYAFFCVLGKFAQMTGQLRYHMNRLLSRQSTLIEYKGSSTLQGGGDMKVAYLVNQYPHVSHSFIRREIVALETQGISVERFSVRGSPSDLVDAGDRAERERTRVILDVGKVGLLKALLREKLTNPWRYAKAFFATIRMGRRSERGVIRHFAYLAEACVLYRWLKEKDVQHLHSHFGTNSTSVALLTRILGGPPYSFTVHGPEEFDRPDNLSLTEKIEKSAFVVAISDFGRSQLFRWCAYPHWSKVNVVRCGVDAAFLSGGPQPIQDNHRLVCVGRLSEQKGQLLIIDALGEVASRSVPFEMVLAGDGPMRSIVEKQIRQLGLEKQVRITGWLSNDEVKQELLGARVMVLPSFAEGLPVVIMEALALGRPVLTTYVAGIPELVQHGADGWLIPAGSVRSLADALVEALKTPIDRLSEMGRDGAARVAAAHDASKEAVKLAALFRKS